MTLPRADIGRNDDSRTGAMVRIPGGTFRMGSNDHYPEQTPVHRVTVDDRPHAGDEPTCVMQSAVSPDLQPS
jgi:formylglycine-generating enzyme required for sulfatase activity